MKRMIIALIAALALASPALAGGSKSGGSGPHMGSHMGGGNGSHTGSHMGGHTPHMAGGTMTDGHMGGHTQHMGGKSGDHMGGDSGRQSHLSKPDSPKSHMGGKGTKHAKSGGDTGKGNGGGSNTNTNTNTATSTAYGGSATATGGSATSYGSTSMNTLTGGNVYANVSGSNGNSGGGFGDIGMAGIFLGIALMNNNQVQLCNPDLGYNCYPALPPLHAGN